MMMMSRSDEGESPDTDASTAIGSTCGADHDGKKKKKKKKKKTTKEVEVEEEGTKQEQKQEQKDSRRNRNTKLSRIRKSRSVQNVYWTLCPAARYEGTNMSMRAGDGDGGSNSSAAAARLHRHLHPLLAAAALRRVADLRGRAQEHASTYATEKAAAEAETAKADGGAQAMATDVPPVDDMAMDMAPDFPGEMDMDLDPMGMDMDPMGMGMMMGGPPGAGFSRSRRRARRDVKPFTEKVKVVKRLVTHHGLEMNVVEVEPILGQEQLTVYYMS